MLRLRLKGKGVVYLRVIFSAQHSFSGTHLLVIVLLLYFLLQKQPHLRTFVQISGSTLQASVQKFPAPHVELSGHLTSQGLSLQSGVTGIEIYGTLISSSTPGKANTVPARKNTTKTAVKVLMIAVAWVIGECTIWRLINTAFYTILLRSVQHAMCNPRIHFQC